MQPPSFCGKSVTKELVDRPHLCPSKYLVEICNYKCPWNSSIPSNFDFDSKRPHFFWHAIEVHVVQFAQSKVASQKTNKHEIPYGSQIFSSYLLLYYITVHPFQSHIWRRICQWIGCWLVGQIWRREAQSSATALFPWGEQVIVLRNGSDAIADDCLRVGTRRRSCYKTRMTKFGIEIQQ